MKCGAVLPTIWTGAALAWAGLAADGIAVRDGKAVITLRQRATHWRLAQARGEDLVRRRNEFYAKQMLEWMRLHKRKPTKEELDSNSYLRKLWRAYQWVKAQRSRKKREWERRRRKRLEQRRQEAEREARREYQQALNYYSRRMYPQAIARFKAILENPDYAVVHQSVEAKLKEMDQLGQETIKRAKQLVAAQDYQRAMARYQSVIVRFRGLPCAKEAAKELEALKEDPQVRARMKKARAEAILKRAERAYTDKNYLLAVSCYEILLRAYKECEEAAIAKAKLDAMRADEEIWNLVVKQRAEAEAQSLLTLARAYLRMQRPQKAVLRLKELIQKHPDSPQAKEAARLLRNIPTTQPTR